MISTEHPQADPLTESIRWLAGWLDRDDGLPRWLPLDPSAGGAPYRSEAELAAIRDECRWLAAHHPFALSAIENRISYTVGAGHHYTVRPRPGEDVSADVLDAIRREILDFCEANEWFDRQAESQRRLDRDGEVFLRFFEAGGRLAVRYVEPEQVRQPPGRGEAAYGVETDPRDAETVTAYWIAADPQRPHAFERVAADAVQHRKANADRTAPRGVPLLYSVRDHLRRSAKLLRNMSTVAGIQAAIAIVRRHAGAAAGSVQQYVRAVADATRSEEGGRLRDYQTFPPGAIVDTPPGVEYSFPTAGIDVAKYVDCLQAELRAIAARLCMPEFMLSADASNANYASTMVAEGPAVKMFERLQSTTIWYDYRVILRALKAAERAGRLPEGVSAMVEIDAEAPIILSRDRLKEAQADQILLSLGVVSPQTVAARHGFNFEQERDLIDRSGE